MCLRYRDYADVLLADILFTTVDKCNTEKFLFLWCLHCEVLEVFRRSGPRWLYSAIFIPIAGL